MLYAAVTAFLWAILPYFLVPLFHHLDVISVIGFRFAISFLILFFFLGRRMKWKFKSMFSISPSVLAAGILLALNYYGFSHGLALTTPATAQILIQSGPLILTLLGVVVFKEQLTRVQLFGLVLAFVGFFIFYSDKLQFLVGDLQNYKTGVIWILFGGVTWGFYAVFHKIACRKHEPQQINLIIYGLSTIFYLPLVDLTKFNEMSSSTWTLLILTGLNTVFAYGAIAESLKQVPATTVSLIICLNPILTMLISSIAAVIGISWIPYEAIKLVAWMGAAMVVIGAVLVVKKRLPILSTKKS